MKKQLFTIGLIIITLIASTSMLSAKPNKIIKGNGNVIKKEFNVNTFKGISIGSVFKIHLKQGPIQSVVIETDDNIMDILDVSVSDNKLNIQQKESVGIEKPTEMNVYITAKELNVIGISGATKLFLETDFITESTFIFDISGAVFVPTAKSTIKADMIIIDISGAAKLDNLNINCNTLTVDASGASKIKLSGVANKKIIEVSGAANVSAENTISKDADIEASGAGTVIIKDGESIKMDKSGAGTIIIKEDGESIKIDKSGTIIIKEGGESIKIDKSGAIKIVD